MDLIAAAGGGVAEGYRHDNAGKRKAAAVRRSRARYERAGSGFVRGKGMGNCVMRRTVG